MPITLGNTNITSSTGTVDITGTGSVKIPVGTTAQRPSSPLNGMIRFNTTLNEFEIYGNGGWKVLSEPFLAEGGTKTISGSNVTHTFTSSGSFVVSGQKTVDVTVLGGGGGGGSGFQAWATGGGGGGFARGTFNLESGTFPVVVGAGGSGQTLCDNNVSGGAGGTSSFNSTFAGFGGLGGAQDDDGPGTGGSFQTTGAVTVISTGNGGNGLSGGFDGSGGGGNNGFGSSFGTGAAGVPNGTPGNHATGNGNGGGGGHSCQGGHRGGGNGSPGIVIITYEI